MVSPGVVKTGADRRVVTTVKKLREQGLIEDLDGRNRWLTVSHSGTEPVLRVYAQGADAGHKEMGL